MRQAELLSITSAPASAAIGAIHERDVGARREERDVDAFERRLVDRLER